MKSLPYSCPPRWVCHFLRTKLVVNIGLVLVLAGIQPWDKIEDLTDRASICLSESLCTALREGCSHHRLQRLSSVWSGGWKEALLSLCSFEGDHSKAPQLQLCKTLRTGRVGTAQPDHPQDPCRAGSNWEGAFNAVVSCAAAGVLQRGEQVFHGCSCVLWPAA